MKNNDEGSRWIVVIDDNNNLKTVKSKYGWPTKEMAIGSYYNCECDGPIICPWCMSQERV